MHSTMPINFVNNKEDIAITLILKIQRFINLYYVCGEEWYHFQPKLMVSKMVIQVFS